MAMVTQSHSEHIQTQIHRQRHIDTDTDTDTHKCTDRDTQTHTMTDKQTEQHHQHNDKCFVSMMASIMRTSRGHTSDVNFSYQRQHAKANHEWPRYNSYHELESWLLVMLVNYLFAGVFVVVMVMTMVMMMITLMMAFIFVNHVCGRSPKVGGARSEKSKSGSNKRESSRLLNNFVSFFLWIFRWCCWWSWWWWRWCTVFPTKRGWYKSWWCSQPVWGSRRLRRAAHEANKSWTFPREILCIKVLFWDCPSWQRSEGGKLLMMKIWIRHHLGIKWMILHCLCSPPSSSSLSSSSPIMMLMPNADCTILIF